MFSVCLSLHRREGRGGEAEEVPGSGWFQFPSLPLVPGPFQREGVPQSLVPGLFLGEGRRDPVKVRGTPPPSHDPSPSHILVLDGGTPDQDLIWVPSPTGPGLGAEGDVGTPDLGPD